MISPRPPIGGAVLCGAAAVLGLAGFLVSELTGQSGWALAGAIVLLAGLVVLALVAWWWRRGALVIDTDPRGFTATATGTRLTARWEEVSAVTATDTELRVRRTAGQSLVLRLPSGARPAAVDALTDDVADCLRTRREPSRPT